MPRLDLGISWRKLTRGLQPEVLISPAKLLKEDTKIKSWYDENGVYVPKLASMGHTLVIHAFAA
jgi:hypothetical protein